MNIEEAFRSPSGTWTPVSPKLATSRRIVLLLSLGLAAIVLGIGYLAANNAGDKAVANLALAGLAACVLLAAWAWWIIGRQVRAMGYAEREDDLLVVRGIMFKQLAIVPYGRMQMVDLKAGPIDRALGIASVQLHTAAATSDAAIDGLEPDQAAALRDRLAERGEQRSAGL